MGGKVGQVINVFWALGTTFFLLKIAGLWRPGNVRFKFLALFFLDALPAFYKTYSQFWGQPYVAFLSTLAVWQFLLAVTHPERLSWKSGVSLGLTWGL